MCIDLISSKHVKQFNFRRVSRYKFWSDLRGNLHHTPLCPSKVTKKGNKSSIWNHYHIQKQGKISHTLTYKREKLPPKKHQDSFRLFHFIFISSPIPRISIHVHMDVWSFIPKNTPILISFRWFDKFVRS